MNETTSSSVPPEVASALAESSADLLHFGMLESMNEYFNVNQASENRSPYLAERSLERRVDESDPSTSDTTPN